MKYINKYIKPYQKYIKYININIKTYFSVPNSPDSQYLKKDGRKTGAFLTKIRALDGRKDGQNSSFCFLKSA